MAKRSSTCVDKVTWRFLWRELQGQPVSGILTGRRTESLCCPQVLTRVTFLGKRLCLPATTPLREDASWGGAECVKSWQLRGSPSDLLEIHRRIRLVYVVYGCAGADLDLHLFSSSNRTWLMICPQSWAGTSGVWFWVCSCWPPSMMPTSSGTRLRFSSILHAKYQIEIRFSRDCAMCAPVWQPLAWTLNPPVFVPGGRDWRSLSHRHSRLKDEWWN